MDVVWGELSVVLIWFPTVRAKQLGDAFSYILNATMNQWHMCRNVLWMHMKG